MSIGKYFFNHPSIPQPNHRADCDLMDTSSTSLPSGVPVVDGVTVLEHMRVLFTNLTTGGNQVYRAKFPQGDASQVSWVAEIDAGHSAPNPKAGDIIHIKSGSANAGRLLVYDSSFVDLDLMVKRQLEVSDSAAATTLGTLDKKMPVYDNAGNLLGYIPIYASIT